MSSNADGMPMVCRWYVALESEKIGHGGDRLLSQISGMHLETIRRGRGELDASVQGRPTDRVRLEGGGVARWLNKRPGDSERVEQLGRSSNRR